MIEDVLTLCNVLEDLIVVNLRNVRFIHVVMFDWRVQVDQVTRNPFSGLFNSCSFVQRIGGKNLRWNFPW